MSENETIRQLVQAALRRQLGAAASRQVVDENVVRAAPEGSTLLIAPDALVTPLARSAALERRITLQTQAPAPADGRPVVAIGADHGGYALKEALKAELSAQYNVLDCGTHSTASVDYPDFALAVAEAVRSGQAWRGIMIDGAGIGSCMVANKVPGVRAAMCYDHATAVNSREHNDANLLTLGAGLLGVNLAKQIVAVWLTTEFGGGRHAARVDKITAVEGRYGKG